MTFCVYEMKGYRMVFASMRAERLLLLEISSFVFIVDLTETLPSIKIWKSW